MLVQRLKYGSVFSAVEISGEANYFFLSLKKKKNELTILKRESYADDDTLFGGIKGCKHLFLVLNNKEVLSKKVDVSHIAKESVVKTAFPNISIGDFYYEVLDCDGFSIVSICRKEVIDNLITQFSNNGISIIDFSIGNSSFQSLIPFLSDTTYYTTSESFEIKSGQITAWNRKADKFKHGDTTQRYSINGLQIEPHFLLSLSGVLTYFKNLSKPIDEVVKRKLSEEYNQKRVFQLGLQFGLGFVLLLVVVNLLFFGSYSQSVSDLKEELVVSETFEKKLQKLNKRVSKKKKLVEGIYAAGNSKVLWYIDQIAVSIPETVLLDNIGYQPVIGSVRKEKETVFIINEIRVTGLTKNDTEFTNWTAVLEEKDWIEKVSIKDIDSKNSKFTEFDFVIHLNASTQ